MKLSEAILLAFLAVFSAVLGLGSLGMQYSGSMTFGPGFLPLNAAIVLLLLIAGSFVRAYMARTLRPADGETRYWGRDDALRMAVALLSLVLCVLAMRVAGVLPPVFLTMVILSWFIGGHPLWRSIAVSAAVLAVIYLIFVVWLGLPVV